MTDKDDETRIEDLETQVRQEVVDAWHSGELEGEYTEDTLFEIADASTPVYNHDVLEVAQSELTLATQDSGYDMDSPVEEIKANINRRLERAARQEWDSLKEMQEYADDFPDATAYFVYYRPDSFQWVVIREDGDKASSIEPGKDKAVAKARELAKKNEPAVVFEYSREGEVLEAKLYDKSKDVWGGEAL